MAHGKVLLFGSQRSFHISVEKQTTLYVDVDGNCRDLSSCRENRGGGKFHPGLTSLCFSYPIACLFSECPVLTWHVEQRVTS